MQGSLTAERFANTIRMQRSQYSGTFVVVEGGSDSRFYQRFFDDATCRLIVSQSYEKAEKVLNILEQDDFRGILAVLDADFRLLEGSVPTSLNIVLTDTHDLETMLLKSPALEKLLVEYGSAEKIKKFETKHGQSVRQVLLEQGCYLGYLLWLSLQENLGLKFKGKKLSYKKFINEQSLVIDIAKMIKTIKDYSQKPSLVEADIQRKLLDLQQDAHDLWQVCCGHHLMMILSVGLSKALGFAKTQAVELETIEKNLRLAYEQAYFIKTQLYQSIKQWEMANQPYKILNDLS